MQPLNFFDTLQARRSIRSFESRPMEPDLLQRILTAANSAPSAGNCQAYQILVVQDEATRRELAAASLDQTFVAQAPVALVFIADPARSPRYGKRGEQLYCLQDATVAAAYAQLAATALGLGSCWVGAFRDEEVARILRLNERQRPFVILPLGYPKDIPEPTSRRPLDELAQVFPPAA